jgi:hypothetical protein
MITFLLIISLLLNGVAIFSILILFTRQNRLLEVKKNQERMIKDVEEIISSSLLEMKEDNEAFIRRFQKISNQPSTSIHSPTTQNKKKAEKEDVPHKIEMMKVAGNSLKKQAVKAYRNSSILPDGNEPQLDVEFTSAKGEEDTDHNGIPNVSVENNSQITQDEIFRDLFITQVQILQKKGLTTAEIAKMLGKGKTEIELLQKFGQSNQ